MRMNILPGSGSRLIYLPLAAVVFAAGYFAGRPPHGAAEPALSTAAREQVASDTLHKVSGGTIEAKKFFSSSGGMIGMLMVDGTGERSIGYATPDGKNVIFGALINDAGINLTVQEMQALDAMPHVAAAAEEPPLPKIATEWVPLTDEQVALLKTLRGIDTGSQADATWVIADPLCGHCREAFAHVSGEGAKAPKIRWFLTGSVGGDPSRELAARVLDGSMTLSAAFSAADGPAAPSTATLDSLVAVDKVQRLLLSLTPTGATPMTLRKINGRWSAQIGFLTGEPS